MNRHTEAEMANVYALAYVSWLIVIYRMLWFMPRSKVMLTVLRKHKALLLARESRLGEGSRPRRKAEPEAPRMIA